MNKERKRNAKAALARLRNFAAKIEKLADDLEAEGWEPETNCGLIFAEISFQRGSVDLSQLRSLREDMPPVAIKVSGSINQEWRKRNGD